MRKQYILTLAACCLFVGGLAAQPTINVISGDQMRIDPSSSVTPNGGEWDIDLVVQPDNNDGGLPTSFRRWWHCEIANLSGSGETLNFTISNAGYSDNITPVVSRDGGATYNRIPSIDDLGTFTFRVTTTGESAIRVAKWFPYTLSQYDTFRATFNTNPRVTETVIGTTALGNSIYMYTITDQTVPDSGKQRVWIHSAVHPSENTAYFNCEGLISWLLSGDLLAESFLDNLILNIVPLANPDGVQLGNYRTSANSTNLENEWTAPYNSTENEIVALRTQIENFMGTAGAPGSNPVELLLNLHATHGNGYPFHFVHVPNYVLPGGGPGVIPAVNTLENNWVNAFRARNAFVNLGSDGNSTLSHPTRPFVEAMMHDRYTVDSSGAWSPIMAITFEGTYQFSGGVTNTDDDYRQMGEDMGEAIADFFSLAPVLAVDTWYLY